MARERSESSMPFDGWKRPSRIILRSTAVRRSLPGGARKTFAWFKAQMAAACSRLVVSAAMSWPARRSDRHRTTAWVLSWAGAVGPPAHLEGGVDRVPVGRVARCGAWMAPIARWAELSGTDPARPAPRATTSTGSGAAAAARSGRAARRASESRSRPWTAQRAHRRPVDLRQRLGLGLAGNGLAP